MNSTIKKLECIPVDDESRLGIKKNGKCYYRRKFFYVLLLNIYQQKRNKFIDKQTFLYFSIYSQSIDRIARQWKDVYFFCALGYS